MILTVGATCEEYGMEINAKEKNNDGRETPGKQCDVNVKGQRRTLV